MSDDILVRAEQAMEGVTPEPWSLYESEGHQVAAVNRDVKFFIALLHPDDCGTEPGPSNIRFIAAARTLVPDLSAALREARIEVAATRSHAGMLEAEAGILRTQRDEARAEVERLREGDWALLSRNLHNAEAGRDEARAEVERLRAADPLYRVHHAITCAGDAAAAILQAQAERDEARAEVQSLGDRVDALREHVGIEARACEEWESNAESAEAGRDEALAAIARVREAVAGQPVCDVHPDGDPIACGWKRAVADIRRALDGDDRG
ncbi:hypothetical protein [Tomitella gaofuii]|uniref:hypothetical protein n=1 Tax=Tomitella gaofuii TaxID=2760083 RepID=UPI0015F97584|nr:hypothetical protein [Tomitella gaofuii]